MGYRGADLDLRTSQTWSASPADLVNSSEPPAHPQASRPQGYRSGPIWVDETVLACANHAFDVSLAHRAGEVGLEHLVHAMTRVNAAAQALEACGVRTAALRRDSAIIIASEIPIGLSEGGGSPRRSQELEQVLRFAAAHAARGNQPAGVDDILHVLFETGSEYPGAGLLMRHVTRSPRDSTRSFGAPRPPPFLGEARFGEVAEPARPPNSGSAANLGEAAREPRPVAAAAADHKDGRLDQVEQTMKLLTAELASERPVFQGMLDRLRQLEHLISEATLASTAQPALDMNPIGHRLDVVEEALSSLGADVKGLVSALGSGAGNGENHEASVAERLQRLAADLDQHRIELGSSLGDRLAAIESALEAQAQKFAEGHNAYSGELGEVHDALMKINANQHTLAGSADEWRASHASDISLINTRLEALQGERTKRGEMLETLGSQVEALSRATADRAKARNGWRYWLFGTDDWIKASWQNRTKPKG